MSRPWQRRRDRWRRAVAEDGVWGSICRTVRWKVAVLLDRRTSQCWSDLVLWALSGDRLRDRRPPFPSESCQAEQARTGGCYCGKFRDPDPDPEPAPRPECGADDLWAVELGRMVRGRRRRNRKARRAAMRGQR